ncbi:hypothetical protein SDJN03_23187, partial [Cucurbita argyrosperma subsp. sororia]
MAVLFNKSPSRATVASALLVGIILCSIPTIAMAAGGNLNGMDSSGNDKVYSVGMPLYRVKESSGDDKVFFVGMPHYKTEDEPSVPISDNTFEPSSITPASAPSPLQSPSPSPSSY